MGNCITLIEEQKIIQINAWNMGEHKDYILVNLNPKLHTKIYGEGMEYSCGCTNYDYR